jgi:hypothetical protein
MAEERPPVLSLLAERALDHLDVERGRFARALDGIDFSLDPRALGLASLERGIRVGRLPPAVTAAVRCSSSAETSASCRASWSRRSARSLAISFTRASAARSAGPITLGR